jgi:hypothetical protein
MNYERAWRSLILKKPTRQWSIDMVNEAIIKTARRAANQPLMPQKPPQTAA